MADDGWRMDCLTQLDQLLESAIEMSIQSENSDLAKQAESILHQIVTLKMKVQRRKLNWFNNPSTSLLVSVLLQ